jgi:hypothetical protein
MKKYQFGIIFGIGIIIAAGIPLLLPRASFVGTVLPDPIMLSAIIASLGLIVLLIGIVLMFKS